MKTYRSSGFTMIELIMVIVLLGFMTSMGLPRYLNLQSEAAISDIRSLEKTMASAVRMVYSTATIQNKPKLANTLPLGTNFITIQGSTVHLAYNYPAVEADLSTSILSLMDLTIEPAGTTIGNDWIYTLTATSIMIWPSNYMTTDNCYVTYTEATSASSGYTLDYNISGC